MRFKVVFLIIASLLTSFNLHAHLAMGVGFTQAQSPYRNVISNPNTIPAYISYEGNKGYLRGTEGGLHLWSQGEQGDKLTLSVLAAMRLEGYKVSDSSYLQGMKNRNWSVDAGFGLALQRGFNRFSAKIVTDTLDQHRGQALDLGYAYIYSVTPKLMFIPSSKLTWQSDNLLNYYFGVAQSEVKIGRDAYKATSGIQLKVSLLANYKINPHTSLLLIASSRRLPASVTDSPLVNKNYIGSVFGAINFSF